MNLSRRRVIIVYGQTYSHSERKQVSRRKQYESDRQINVGFSGM